jgi:hypothetical protein
MKCNAECKSVLERKSEVSQYESLSASLPGRLSVEWDRFASFRRLTVMGVQ